MIQFLLSLASTILLLLQEEKLDFHYTFLNDRNLRIKQNLLPLFDIL